MKKSVESEARTDAVDRYLAETGEVDAGDSAVFARCDAVMALIPRIGGSSGIGWAFDEARRLARAAPGGQPRSTERPWYLNPAVAWSSAAALAVALVVTGLLRAPTGITASGSASDGEPAPPPRVPATNITFAPIVITPELAQMLADIQPVLVLANETPVDARSLAVLPFAEQDESASQTSSVAESIYALVLRQLSAVPGIIVVDAATAAIYSESELAPEDIALQLGVRGIVEGRIESIDGEVRFALRLTDAAAAGASIDEAIERPAGEIALLQTDITSSVLSALARTQPPIQPSPGLPPIQSNP